MNPTGAALVSGEGVALELPTAGVASRALAAGVDLLVQGFALMIILGITAASMAGSDGASIAAVVVSEVVAMVAGYPIVMEWLTRGRTLGKMALGLRVVRDDGGPIAFRQALVRGLAGLVVEKPGVLVPLSTFAALGAIASSNRDKRIGDMMAGTVVLNERAASQPTASAPLWVPPELQRWALSMDLSRFDQRLGLAVRQFVSRAYAMSPGAQQSLGDELVRRTLAVISPPPPPGTSASAILQSVLAERRRRSGETVLPPGGWAQPWWGAPGPFAAPQPFGAPDPFAAPQPFGAPDPFAAHQPFGAPDPFGAATEPRISARPGAGAALDAERPDSDSRGHFTAPS